MATQKEEIIRQYEAASERACALFAGLDAAGLLAQPRPKSWSVAENLVHLTLTTAAYLPLIKAAVAEAKQKGLPGQEPFRMDLLGKILRWFAPERRAQRSAAASFWND